MNIQPAPLIYEYILKIKRSMEYKKQEHDRIYGRKKENKKERYKPMDSIV